jgi:hypothetical protein
MERVVLAIMSVSGGSSPAVASRTAVTLPAPVMISCEVVKYPENPKRLLS